MSDRGMSASEPPRGGTGFPPDRSASASPAKVEGRAPYSVTTCYANPNEILKSPQLSRQQKRKLLCKWAFDAYRVEVTATGGIPPCSPSRLDEVIDALVELDVGSVASVSKVSRISPPETTDTAAVRVGDVYSLLCASPAYLKSRRMPKSLDDLARHDCITYIQFRSPDMWTFKREQTEYVVPVHSRLRVSNMQSACDAARAGIGITPALSYQITEHVRSGELTLVLRDFMSSQTLPVSFVYSPDRFMPVKLRSFLDFALPRLKTRLDDLPKGVRPTARGKRGHKA
jgi:LysR substrate binding domain